MKKILALSISAVLGLLVVVAYTTSSPAAPTQSVVTVPCKGAQDCLPKDDLSTTSEEDGYHPVSAEALDDIEAYWKAHPEEAPAAFKQ